MGNDKRQKKLAKLLDYALGRKPEEFGLFPDKEGYVKTKELLKALWEEGMRQVRLAQLKEIMLVMAPSPIELDDNKIRAADRSHLPQSRPAMEIPRLLYTCIRRRAYPRVAQKGLAAGEGGPIKLAAKKAMAQRIGKRIDAKPVLLTVHTDEAIVKGTIFLTTGENLFTTDWLDSSCLTGPPLPKEKPTAEKKDVPVADKKPLAAGSFFPDTERTSKKSVPSWAGEASGKGSRGEGRGKKRKRQRERPPWRK